VFTNADAAPGWLRDPVLGTAWRLAPGVSFRSEPFGGMANDFESRRLTFVRSPQAAAVLEMLDGRTTVLEACRRLSLDDRAVPAIGRALQTLVDKQLLVRHDDETTSAGSPVPLGRPADPTGASRPPVRAVPAPSTHPAPSERTGTRLADQLSEGLDAPICITWELTYACNLACTHCLSSSGRRDPAELSTAECERVIDDLERMHVFYANVGGGEPTVRRDFWYLLDYACDHHLGIKFSTNGTRIDRRAAERLAHNRSVDVQISLDGATAEVNDAIRGVGSHAAALAAMERLGDAGVTGFKLSVVATRHNVDQLDELASLADRYGAQLRVTRLRPSGRAADIWDDLRLTDAHQRLLFAWLHEHGDRVLTGDSFFHLGALGAPLPGINLCGAGRIVCLIDPVGDVYACPFTIHEAFRAGNVRSEGGFSQVWQHSSHFASLRSAQPGETCASCGAVGICRGGCMAAKFFTGRALDDPDPECVTGHALVGPASASSRPAPTGDHSRRRHGTPVTIVRRKDTDTAGFRAGAGAGAGSSHLEVARG